MKFSYRQYQVTPSPTVPTGVLLRPEIPIRIIGNAGDAFLWALVDTGSDELLLPQSVANRINATQHAGMNWKIEGIGGQQVSVTLGDVELELRGGGQTFRWPAKVGFVAYANPQDEAVVLGRTGFLEHFRVTFDGHQHELEIQVTPAFPGKVI